MPGATLMCNLHFFGYVDLREEPQAVSIDDGPRLGCHLRACFVYVLGPLTAGGGGGRRLCVVTEGASTQM